jgi:hypothetical protein
VYLLLKDRRIPKALDHELKTHRSLKSQELVLSIARAFPKHMLLKVDQREVGEAEKLANEKYMPWIVVIDVFIHC